MKYTSLLKIITDRLVKGLWLWLWKLWQQSATTPPNTVKSFNQWLIKIWLCCQQCPSIYSADMQISKPPLTVHFGFTAINGCCCFNFFLFCNLFSVLLYPDLLILSLMEINKQTFSAEKHQLYPRYSPACSIFGGSIIPLKYPFSSKLVVGSTMWLGGRGSPNTASPREVVNFPSTSLGDRFTARGFSGSTKVSLGSCCEPGEEVIP